MKPLKIAVYYPWVYLKGGIERSMLSLISRNRHEWTIYTSHFVPEKTFAEFGNLKVVVVGNVSVERSIGSVLKSALSISATRLPLAGFDAFAVWCDGLGTLTTFRNHGRPTFCICSTPLRAVYDPVYAQQALAQRNLLGRLAYHLFKHAFRAVDRRAWRNFAGVVATSQEVKQRIVDNRLYAESPKMILSYPGIDVADAPDRVAYEPFLLVPGRISWTKNIQLAVEAFKRAGLPAPWRLVIAGFVDQKSQPHLAELKRLAGDHARIEFVRDPSDEVLNQLYRDAYAVLFPPLNEDWGIVPLEGMLRSKPIIANARGGPAESVQDGVTGWLLQPDAGQWAELLRTLPAREAEVREMGRQARIRVGRYDWSRFATDIDDLIAASFTQPERNTPVATAAHSQRPGHPVQT